MAWLLLTTYRPNDGEDCNDEQAYCADGFDNESEVDEDTGIIDIADYARSAEAESNCEADGEDGSEPSQADGLTGWFLFKWCVHFGGFGGAGLRMARMMAMRATMKRPKILPTMPRSSAVAEAGMLLKLA